TSAIEPNMTSAVTGEEQQSQDQQTGDGQDKKSSDNQDQQTGDGQEQTNITNATSAIEPNMTSAVTGEEQQSQDQQTGDGQDKKSSDNQDQQTGDGQDKKSETREAPPLPSTLNATNATAM